METVAGATPFKQRKYMMPWIACNVASWHIMLAHAAYTPLNRTLQHCSD